VGVDPLGHRGRVAVALLIFVVYTVSFILRGAVLPGIVGGALGGLLMFLVLREVEARRRRRERDR
jgi:membrane associated rhomboid family serine protease